MQRETNTAGERVEKRDEESRGGRGQRDGRREGVELNGEGWNRIEMQEKCCCWFCVEYEMHH